MVSKTESIFAFGYYEILKPEEIKRVTGNNQNEL